MLSLRRYCRFLLVEFPPKETAPWPVLPPLSPFPFPVGAARVSNGSSNRRKSSTVAESRIICWKLAKLRARWWHEGRVEEMRRRWRREGGGKNAAASTLKLQLGSLVYLLFQTANATEGDFGGGEKLLELVGTSVTNEDRFSMDTRRGKIFFPLAVKKKKKNLRALVGFGDR